MPIASTLVFSEAGSHGRSNKAGLTFKSISLATELKIVRGDDRSVIQGTNNGDLDQSGYSRGSVKWLDPRNTENVCQLCLLMDWM